MDTDANDSTSSEENIFSISAKSPTSTDGTLLEKWEAHNNGDDDDCGEEAKEDKGDRVWCGLEEEILRQDTGRNRGNPRNVHPRHTVRCTMVPFILICRR